MLDDELGACWLVKTAVTITGRGILWLQCNLSKSHDIILAQNISIVVLDINL